MAAFRGGDRRLEVRTRAAKCCALVTAGAHPEHDTHLCLREKGHQGYYKDELTGFSW